MEILKWLDSSDIIARYDVIEYKTWETGRYYKIDIYLKNDTVVYAREYFDHNERNYSFHWQDKNGILIIRWDNAPHHIKIKTHPHHKHQTDEVTESYDITLDTVLVHIARVIHE